jgi:hypothetical protein
MITHFEVNSQYINREKCADKLGIDEKQDLFLSSKFSLDKKLD